MPVFPLLIFSHGLGGTRTTYSTLCGEFASYGFVVVSLEHRDGSGPRTFINLPEREQERHENVKKVAKNRRDGCSRMDYVFPKNNAMDTSPANKQGVDGELRAAQIQLRLAEIEEAYHAMCRIHEGDGKIIAMANLRTKPTKGASSRGLQGIDWESWRGRFHLLDVTMLGHSFGAATTIEVLRQRNRFRFVGQGVIYDIWGAAIQPPEDIPEHRIDTPLLGINSEAFMYWPDNFESVMSLCKEAKGHDALVWLMTVRGSVHISQSDFSLLYPHISSLFLKMTCNPRRAIDLNINASLEFLKIVMPSRISRMNRGTNEHLLEVSTLDKLPQDRKPEEKYTARRLRIPHEARLRLIPNRTRRYLRNKRKRSEEATLPKDLIGKPLIGLEDFKEGEIWMHVAPTKEELERHSVNLDKAVDKGTNGGDRDGMVEVTGNEGRTENESKGIEEMYMDRG